MLKLSPSFIIYFSFIRKTISQAKNDEQGTPLIANFNIQKKAPSSTKMSRLRKMFFTKWAKTGSCKKKAKKL